MTSSAPITVLAGDLGGTKTLLQIARFESGQTRPSQVLHEQRFESWRFKRFETLLGEFLQHAELEGTALQGACLGVAGPVTASAGGQQARLTNLPWALDSHALAKASGIARLRLINDFQAIGHGIEALAEEDLICLHEGEAVPDGPRVVLGAGTGLGVALLFADRVWPTEAGHRDFAPNGAQQQALLSFLARELGHVSYERLLSGPGLVNIYRFILHQHNHDPGKDGLLLDSDPAEAISDAVERNPHARQALSLFLDIYAAEAGNLALTALATGGVYLAGGIAPKISHLFEPERFSRLFCDKGRMQPLLETIPVHIVSDPLIGLCGAALCASRL